MSRPTRPVTLEVAGSSPVAPVQKLGMALSSRSLPWRINSCFLAFTGLRLRTHSESSGEMGDDAIDALLE